MELSVIIPTFNRNDSLVECLQSLEHNDVEFIVIDDGSSVPVEVPCNVRLIRHERNRGRAAAINSGLRAASHNLVLILDDDIYAAPDMVVRLTDEFAVWNSPKLALSGRVIWDPDVRMTLTMRWLEESGPLKDISANRSGLLSNLVTGNTLMWRPFILQHGGFDETLTLGGLEDTELGLRLKHNGLEIRLVATAIGYHHKTVRVGDLVKRELREGAASVYLHSKFHEYLPQVEDTQSLLRNVAMEKDAVAAVGEIALLETSESSRLQSGMSDLFMRIYRYYFLTGVLNGLDTRGELQQSSGSTATQGLYHQASHLASIGEYGEARRLFLLVRNRRDSEFWAGAEYHLGVIDSESGDSARARLHFTNCLALNPQHRKASEGLKCPTIFREIEAGVFERISPLPKSRILFVLFGELDDILNAFPIVASLHQKFHGTEIVWLTSPEYVSLVSASMIDGVRECRTRGVIAWDAVVAEGFTHVFHPDVGANCDEWENSGLHPLDFMARKCGVVVESRRAWLEPGPQAHQEAANFMHEFGLATSGFLTICHSGETRRHWPCHNLHKLATATGMPVVVIGDADESPVAGTIPCLGRSHRMLAALIERSAFYLGPDSGISWIAASTNTAMGVFSNAVERSQTPNFVESLAAEKEELVEWGPQTRPEAVIEHIASLVLTVGAASGKPHNPNSSRLTNS